MCIVGEFFSWGSGRLEQGMIKSTVSLSYIPPSNFGPSRV
jgi:hypothetical protein